MQSARPPSANTRARALLGPRQTIRNPELNLFAAMSSGLTEYAGAGVKLSDFRRHPRLSVDAINALEPRKERRMNAEGARNQHIRIARACRCNLSAGC